MASFVVIGLGRFGTAVALELMDARCEVLAIDIDEKNIQQISERVTDAVVADARDVSVLKNLGVENCDCAVVSMGSDIASSIIITMNLKELGVPNVVCKAGSEDHKKALLKVGADSAIIPEKEMAVRVARNLASSKVFDYIEMGNGYSIVERSAPSKFAGKQLKNLNIPKKYSISLVGIRRDGKIRMCPGADDFIEENDTLLVMGHEDDLERFGRI